MDRLTRVPLAGMALTLAFAPAASAAPDPNKISQKLRDDVIVPGIRAHQQALQTIATMNNGSRASGTPGYDQLARYGGVTGEAYDRCYHQACDTFSNVSIPGLRTLSDGAAHATAVYAARVEPLGPPAANAKGKSAASKVATKLGGDDQR